MKKIFFLLLLFLWPGCAEDSPYVPSHPYTPRSSYTPSQNQSSFPAPQAVGRTSSSYALWELKNDTAYSLTVDYKGPKSGSITVYQGKTFSLYLSGGSYTVSATLSKVGVKPYAGNILLKQGWKYQTKFFIKGSTPTPTTPATSNNAANKTSYYCSVYFTPPIGEVGKYFYARITYSSNYITTPNYFAAKLPPGLSYNTTSGVISGYPSQAGRWQVEVGLRDLSKGTHAYPYSKDRWYLRTDPYIEIRASTPAVTNPVVAPPTSYSPFPTPQSVGKSYTSSALWEIKNGTAYSIYLTYNGPESGSIMIPPSQTKSVSLKGGSYTVQGSSGKPGVQPYYGTVQFTAGWKYATNFFIQTK